MPRKAGSKPTTEQEEISLLKDKAVEYYRRLPVKKLAAAKVGRSYDAFNEWEKNDAIFARRLQEAKADFALKQVESRKMTPQFALERIFKEEFSQRTELTGPDGGPIQVEKATFSLLPEDQ